MITGTTKPLRAKQVVDVKSIAPLVEYLSKMSVKRFSYHGLEIELDTFVAAASRADPADLDVKAEPTKFQDLRKREEEDMFWSSGK